jgi:hypothetical protein
MPFAYELIDTPAGSGARRAHTKEKDPKLPTFTHPQHDAMIDTWRDLRILAAGTRPVWANADRFLMKLEQEDSADFYRRAKMASVFNGFRRVIRASTGMVMAKPVQLGDTVTDEFRAAAENIDGEGTHLDIFTRKLLNDGLTVGMGGILVDWPGVADPEQLSHADEMEAGLRPYFCQVLAENILMWRYSKVQGGNVMTLLVLQEPREEEVGDFGVGVTTYYRVFRRAITVTSTAHGIIERRATDEVTWELWKWDEQQKKPVLSEAARVLRGAKRIPFSPLVIGDEAGSMSAEPPLQDLADVNVNHYQVATDRAWVMHLACIPVPVRKGHVPKLNAAGDVVEQSIGPNMVVDVDKEGDFYWRSPDATAFGPTKDELEALERRMGALGLSFLFPESRAQETAAAKRLDKTAENASLSSVVRATRDCLENAMDLFDEYLGLEQASGEAGDDDASSLTLNTDFEQLAMDAGVATLLSDMEAKGQLTLDTLLEQLVAGKILPEDFDVEHETEQLAQKAADMARQMMKLVPGGNNAPPDGAPDSPYAKPKPGDKGAPPVKDKAA